MSCEEAQFALDVLMYLFPTLPQHSQLAPDAVVLEELKQHSEKTSGFPWNMYGAPSKGQALEKFGLTGLEEYYAAYTSVIGSTLKDELREQGKDARFFRPQDVSSYIEGCRLFYNQNELLMRTLESPVFVKFCSPGQDFPRMLRKLMEHGGECYAADGSRWDANFQVFVAQILCCFRSLGADKERVFRYYCQMYCGVTNVQGNVFRLFGQPSGHYNTSTDNSLGHIVLMSIHAFRHNMTIEAFIADLLFYACGDDIIWSTISDTFAPELIDETYSSCGVFLEFESLTSRSPLELTFVGCKGVWKKIHGLKVLLYSLVGRRSLASLHCDKKGRKPIDHIAKLASLAQLFFADEERYNIAVMALRHRLAEYVAAGVLSLSDPSVVGLLRSVDPEVLTRQYLSWEHVF